MGLIIDRTTFDVLAQDLVGVPALLLHESPADGLGKLGSIQKDAAPEMAKDKTMKVRLDAESQQRCWMQNKDY